MAKEPESTLIYIDVETNALRGNKLLQIGAITDTNITFSVYINPKEILPQFCSNLTGLVYHRNNLYKNGRIVHSISISKALKDFRTWVLQFASPVYLIGHNLYAFDIKILLRHFFRHNVKFPENVEFVFDTLPVFRKTIKETDIPNHKLGTLANYYEIILDNAHDALSDSIALKDICEKQTKTNKTDVITFLEEYKKPLSFFQKQIELKNGQ